MHSGWDFGSPRRAPGLRTLVAKIVKFVRSQIDPPDSNCKFGRAMREILCLAVVHRTVSVPEASRDIKVTPHVAHNTRRTGSSAIDGCTTRHGGYAMSQRRRKCIEQCFGRGKTISLIRQVMVGGLDKVNQLLTLTVAAYNSRGWGPWLYCVRISRDESKNLGNRLSERPVNHWKTFCLRN